MKKYLMIMAVMLTSAALFTACDDKDNSPKYYPVVVTNGAYVICGGNQSSNINSSVTYVDYATKTAAQNQFRAKNGRQLGLTANDAVVYGSKMYVVVTEEQTIEVLDAKTLMSLKQIKLTQLAGEVQGFNPRHITAADGKIFVSTYGSSKADWNSYTTSGNGYVAAIDTLNYSLAKVYAAGCYPEGVYVFGNSLFVANSDYSMGQKASISCIDLQTGVDTPLTNSLIVNPTELAVSNLGVFVLDMGNYSDIPAGVRLVTATGAKTLFECTHASFMGTNIYAVNSIYGTIPENFFVYNIVSGQKSTFPTGLKGKFFSPNVIEADPITGNIFIASYNENESRPGYANYSSNGYVLEYSPAGSLLNTYDCGVGPNAIVFNTDVEYVKMN